MNIIVIILVVHMNALMWFGYVRLSLGWFIKGFPSEVIALHSRASKKIDLYSNHTENNLQVLTFAAITFICTCLWCWDLA